jgi:predicted lipoprotein with Yx(FWY)xxD motif
MNLTSANARLRPGRLRLLGGIAVLAGGVALAACNGGGGTASGSNMNSGSHPRGSATASPARTAATIGLATNATIGQNVLVDSQGRTVYLFVPDGASPQSTVPVQFKPNWPSVTSMGTPSAGSGLDTTKLGVQTQTDGTRQVSYAGHLLYTFINDTAPGDAKGQGLGPNNWFVLGADGNPIGAPAPQPTVSLSPNAKIGQPILVDAHGMTLYLFVPDGTGTQTTVPPQFKPNWPQLTATGAPVGGTGLDATKFAVQTQTDGMRQVSYGGHLLYTFVMDKAPGDVNGQALGPNNWFVLDANGNAIRATAATAAATPAPMPAPRMGW